MLKERSISPGDPRERNLSSFITQLIRKETDLDLPKDFFVQLLGNDQGVLLLLDGLDEVFNEDEREVVREEIERLVTTREGMRVIVTCRTAAYNKGRTALGRGFRKVVVKELDSGHIRNMVHKFYQCIHPHGSNEAAAQTNQLMGEIELLESQRRHSQAARKPLINSPLMVRLLLIVRYHGGRIPEERAEFFMRASKTMLQHDYLPDVEVQQSLNASVRAGGNTMRCCKSWRSLRTGKERRMDRNSRKPRYGKLFAVPTTSHTLMP